ncbi:MAG: helix-turn-helix domain-containing protein [Spirochaetales bacterium]
MQPTTLSVHVLCVELRKNLLWNYTQLRAPFWRFYWNLSGTALITVGAMEVLVEPGRPYLIPPDTDFSTKVDEPINHLFVHFTLEAPKTPARADGVPPGIYAVGENEEDQILSGRQIDMLAREVDSDDPRQTAHAAGVVLLALGSLQPRIPTVPPHDAAVTAAMAHIEQNLHRTVAARELARVAACGERTLRRRFHEAFGQTPAAYALRRRVDRACILLHFSDRSIEEVAGETGFCDRFHFTRVFTRHRGMSPALFRKAREELSEPHVTA